MGFLHSCFIESSDEAISWLEDTLGCGMILAAVDNEDDMWILFDHEFEGWQFVDSEVKGMILNSDEGEINCLGNIPLFKAITAMRDDSGLYQWHKADSEILVLWSDTVGNSHCGIVIKGEVFMWDLRVEHANVFRGEFHKMNLKELINHFKK